MRICFKAPDARAGQMVELDEAGAQREIANGTAEEVSDDDWNTFQQQLAQAERAPAPGAAKKKARGK